MFNGLQLTNKGIELLTNLLNGHNIQFTTIKMGDGTKPSDISGLTDLVSVKQTLAVARNSIVDQRTMLIGANLYGSLVEQDFYWREVGLFAKDLDGDGVEYLFSYDNAGDEASFIPAGGAVAEQLIDLNVIVGNVDNVVIEINKSLVYATIQDLETVGNNIILFCDEGISAIAERLEEEIGNHVGNKNNPHGVTKAQLGLGSVENYGVATDAEAKAGTSNAKYMTPARVKDAMVAMGAITDGNVIIKIGSSQPSAQSGKTIIWINTGS